MQAGQAQGKGTREGWQVGRVRSSSHRALSWVPCQRTWVDPLSQKPGREGPVFLQEAEGAGKKGHANPPVAEDDSGSDSDQGEGIVAMAVSEKEQGQCSLVKGQGKGILSWTQGASHNFTPFVADFNGVMEPPEVRTVRVGTGSCSRSWAWAGSR